MEVLPGGHDNDDPQIFDWRRHRLYLSLATQDCPHWSANERSNHRLETCLYPMGVQIGSLFVPTFDQFRHHHINYAHFGRRRSLLRVAWPYLRAREGADWGT